MANALVAPTSSKSISYIVSLFKGKRHFEGNAVFAYIYMTSYWRVTSFLFCKKRVLLTL